MFHLHTQGTKWGAAVVVTSVREPATFVFWEMLHSTLLQPYNLTRPEPCPSWKTKANKYEHNIRRRKTVGTRIFYIIYDLLLLSSLLLLFNVLQGCYCRRHNIHREYSFPPELPRFWPGYYYIKHIGLMRLSEDLNIILSLYCIMATIFVLRSGAEYKIHKYRRGPSDSLCQSSTDGLPLCVCINWHQNGRLFFIVMPTV